MVLLSLLAKSEAVSMRCCNFAVPVSSESLNKRLGESCAYEKEENANTMLFVVGVVSLVDADRDFSFDVHEVVFW
ncbi:hypothetical protein E2542_SST20009 [Spatholobus suberectus]|nr:hypothetical protein E2542_SST20009 [Spatholobus suberectus]